MPDVTAVTAGSRKTGVEPAAAGILGAFLLSVFYYLLVSLSSRSWNHVLEILPEDWPYLAAIVAGFGVQVGLFARLRQVLRRRNLSGNLVSSAGTSASTVSMVACCAHHLADVLPAIGLSGAAIFLNGYKYQVMGIGIAVNLIGIFMMARILLKHQKMA